MEILEARVIQKVGTEAEWLANPLPLLDGEAAIVRTGDGTPVNLKFGLDGKTFAELPYFIDYSQAVYIAYTATPTQPVAYTFVGEGTYGAITVAEGYMAVLGWDGTSWSKNAEISLPNSITTDEIAPGEELPPSSDAVFNLLDNYVSIPNPQLVSIGLYAGFGNFTTSGNYSTSNNWISTRIINIDPSGGEDFEAIGFQDSESKNIIYYTASDTLNQTMHSVPIPSGVTSHSWSTPSGYTKMIVNVARGTNIGLDIPNSPFSESFKLINGYSNYYIKTDTIKDRIESDQLLEIESNILNLESRHGVFYGLGFPQYELGQNGDSFFDKSSKCLFNKVSGKWKRNVNSRFYPVRKPVDFVWDIGRRIMYQENGKSFIEGWKGLFEEKAKSDYDRLTKYYVSPTGSNSNDGLTPQTPVLTVQYAHGTLGARNIILAPGFYGITNNARMNKIVDNNTTTEPFIVRCLDGFATMARVYLGSIYTWTANGDCYQTARTNVINVIDVSYLDEKGNPLQPTKVNSIAECQSTPNSFYATPSTIYVHTFDNRVPDENIYLCFAETTGYTAGQNVPYVYMENIKVINQNPNTAFLFDNNASVQYDTKVYLKSCFAGYNSQGNAIGIDNIKEAILEGCSGAYLLRDGLNYHTTGLSLCLSLK